MTDIANPAETLWTRARAMFARAVAAIGDAASIARIATLTPQLRRGIIAWLCPLENIVRKLLLAEAARLHRAAIAQTRGPRLVYVPLRSPGWTAGLQARNATVEQTCAPEGARSNLETARSYTLDNARFSFSLPRDPHAIPDSRAPRIRSLWGAPPPPPATPTQRSYDESKSPLRLARRFAALRRVLDDPRPHAERLARLLARAVRRFPEIVRRYAFAPARTNDYDPDDPRLAIEAIAQAFAAPNAFSNSS